MSIWKENKSKKVKKHKKKTPNPFIKKKKETVVVKQSVNNREINPELDPPSQVEDSLEAMEFLRAWSVHHKHSTNDKCEDHCCNWKIETKFRQWDDPERWGFILSEIIKQIAKRYETGEPGYKSNFTYEQAIELQSVCDISYTWMEKAGGTSILMYIEIPQFSDVKLIVSNITDDDLTKLEEKL